MLEEIRNQLKIHLGHLVEIKTKQAQTITGKISWLSPDRSMAEISLDDGQIKTITDIQIKSIKQI